MSFNLNNAPDIPNMPNSLSPRMIETQLHITAVIINNVNLF